MTTVRKAFYVTRNHCTEVCDTIPTHLIRSEAHRKIQKLDGEKLSTWLVTFRRLVFSWIQIDPSGQGLIAQHLSRSARWSPYNSTKRFVIFQNFSTNCGRIQRSFLEFTRRCRFLENIFITEMAMSTEMLSSTVYRLQLDEICLFVDFRL